MSEAPGSNGQEFVTIADAARRLGISERQARRDAGGLAEGVPGGVLMSLWFLIALGSLLVSPPLIIYGGRLLGRERGPYWLYWIGMGMVGAGVLLMLLVMLVGILAPRRRVPNPRAPSPPPPQNGKLPDFGIWLMPLVRHE